MKKFFLFLSVLLSMNFIFAVDFNVNDYTESELRQIRNLINLELALYMKGDVIFEDENVCVSFIEWERNNYGSSLRLWVSIINKTDKQLVVYANNTSINECSVDLSRAIRISSGKRTNAIMISISDDVLERQCIDSVDSVEFFMRYFDEENLFPDISFWGKEPITIKY